MKHTALLALAMASVVSMSTIASAQTVAPWVSITPPPGATATVTLRVPAYGAPPAALTPASPVVAPAPSPVGWAPAQPTLYGQDEARPSRAGRWLVQSLAGLGAGVGGALLGGLVGVAAGANDRGGDCVGAGPCGGGMNLGPLLLGVGIGWFGGVPLGVTLAGNARGGNGGYGWSLLGTLGGSMAAGLLGYAINPEPREGSSATGYLALLGGVAGALVGYELSNTADRGAQRVPARTAAVRLSPSASASPQGAVMGIAGTF